MEGPDILGEQMGSPVPGESQREKMWVELTDAEKVERMHGVVRHLQVEIGRLQVALYRMERHEHGSLGGVLVPFNAYGSYDVPVAGDKDRWF